jgi:transposase
MNLANKSKLKPIMDLAKSVETHIKGIVRHFASGLTSGIMEGLNSQIQEVKRRARGFRNISNFISMIYIVAGGLDFARLIPGM